MLVFQKWQSQILQTTKNAPQTLAATCQEWQRLRIVRRNERLEKRRLEIYEQLVAFQSLKREIQANHQGKQEQPTSSCPLGWALVRFVFFFFAGVKGWCVVASFDFLTFEPLYPLIILFSFL
jgi:hypothetical protein